MVTFQPDTFEQWLTLLAASTGIVLLVQAGYWLVLKGFRRVLRTEGIARRLLDEYARALGVVLAVVIVKLLWNGISTEFALYGAVERFLTLALILALTWTAARCSIAVGEVVVHLNPPSDHDYRQARKIETQTRFISRGFNILVIIVGLGAALMTFPSMDQIGTSLLASAGIGGIVLGFAARPVLTNLLAGIQIALTQPFRIDDVVYVQGEWCWVEEVTSTYVVLRVWDLRRLVVPLQWFVDNPFENWSRTTPHLLGTVFLWIDYRMPVELLRDEFTRLLQEAPQWDGRTNLVQVTDADARAMQVRFLMSAPNSTQNWELRCRIREGLVAYIQREYPQYLPRLRAQLEGVRQD